MTQPDPGPKQPLGPAEPHKLDCDEATFALLRPLAEQYGDVVRVHCAERKHPQFLLSNPRDLKHVLVSNHRNYVKGVGFERVEMLLGNGIIVSDGAFWRRQRTMIQPAFSRGSIPRYFEMMKAITLELADDWQRKAEAGETLDITTEMSEYALQIILRAIFSDDLEGLVEQFGANPFSFLTEDPSRNLMVAMRFRQLLKQVQRLIHERREQDRRPFDLLSTMMDARASRTGEAMTDRELIDEVATMIIAGHETSAGTLNWAWYLLSGHPQAEARLAAECEAVCPDGDLHYEQVAELTWTQQVLEETLRLYPPVWIYTRRAVDDDVVGGYPIRAGDHLFLSPWLTQRLGRYWDEPDEFRPERFSEDGKAAQEPYAFFPFSAGPRRCIGEFFSFVEMKAHLAIMARRFRLTHLPDGPVELEPAINLRVRHPLRMRIELKGTT